MSEMSSDIGLQSTCLLTCDAAGCYGIVLVGMVAWWRNTWADLHIAINRSEIERYI